MKVHICITCWHTITQVEAFRFIRCTECTQIFHCKLIPKLIPSSIRLESFEPVPCHLTLILANCHEQCPPCGQPVVVSGGHFLQNRFWWLPLTVADPNETVLVPSVDDLFSGSVTDI